MALGKVGRKSRTAIALPEPIWPEGWEVDANPRKPFASACTALLSVPANVQELAKSLYRSGIKGKVEAIRELADRVDGPTIRAIAHADFTQDMKSGELDAKIERLLARRGQREIPKPSEDTERLREDSGEGAEVAPEDLAEAFGSDDGSGD
jgi:hypothetical protein